MTPSARSYNACLAGAFLLTVLAAVIVAWTTPQILEVLR